MRKTCWICRLRPADSGEHRFKASDIRARLPGLSQKTPVYMQRDGRNTNRRIGAAGADALKFGDSLCRQCNSTDTQRYDRAWERLSGYLHANWSRIARSRRFDLSKPFPGTTRDAALDVHLFFVKLFGCKIFESKTNIDLSVFSRALIARVPHPEICLQVADATGYGSEIVAYDTDVYTVHNERRQLDGATWGYRIHPVCIKVHWIRTGVPLLVRGYTWRAGRSGKIIRLGAYEGAIEPKNGPKAWIAPESNDG